MNFIRRNMPVLIIGGLTLIVFVIIIIAGQKNPPTPPNLVELDEEKLIAAHTYVIGNTEAPVTLVEFADFKCSACAIFHPKTKNLYEKYGDYLRIAYRHYPLPQHKGAKDAAVAAQVAGEQGMFWEYADILFANQNEEFNNQTLLGYAQHLEMDMQRFSQDLKNKNFASIIDDDIKAAKQIGIAETPTFFLNGKKMEITSLENFEEQIMQALDPYIPQEASITPSTNPAPINLTEEEKIASQQVLQIIYTPDGWEPRSTTGFAGQTVRWINATQEEIYIEQLDIKFDEFKEPRKIEPGGVLEFELYKDRLWRYQEKNTKNWGSIFIREIN